MRIYKSICLAAAMAILISGCGSAKSSTAPTSAYTPTLEVSAVVNGDAVTLQMTTDLKISKEHYDHQRVEGEGHVHISLDKGEKIVVTDKQKVLDHLSKGPHEVKVSLHNNDHTPYDVSKTITFDVK
ncbi:hypothetical protein GQF01_34405 [Paenibacillus sp. 5J-6]|uniref:YtkA-like domain-containing protein n=1 Tax=Paenibacillus silvestris TaxID=2606219 RepID=A0A6L8VDD1_9BACL|nr:hypothetical protein [Paenibacillus silvestris]MZQ87220.1 hypothetical protein [Paenibacillus silvestris]